MRFEQGIAEFLGDKVIQLDPILLKLLPLLLQTTIRLPIQTQLMLVVQIGHQIVADAMHYGDVAQEFGIVFLHHVGEVYFY